MMHNCRTAMDVLGNVEGDASAMKDQLLALPQDDDVWIAGAQLLTVPGEAGEEQAVWLLVIQSRSQHVVVGTEACEEEPDPQTLLTALINAMVEPEDGPPRRPTAVETGPNLTWDPVAPMLEGIGVAVRPAGTLYDLNTVFQYLAMQMTGKPIPDLPIEPE